MPFTATDLTRIKYALEADTLRRRELNLIDDELALRNKAIVDQINEALRTFNFQI